MKRLSVTTRVKIVISAFAMFLISFFVSAPHDAFAAPANISVGSPYWMVTSADGSKLYVTGYVTDNVTVIDTATNTVDAIIDLGTGSGPRSAMLSQDGHTLFVTTFFNGDLVSIDTATNQISSTTTLGLSYPRGAALSPDGQFLFVAGQDFIYKINAVTKSVVSTIPVTGVVTYGAIFSTDGSKVYVTGTNTDQLFVIDVSSATIINTVSIGDAPQGLVITPDGSKIFIANQRDSTTSVFSIASNTVVATIPTQFEYNGSNIDMDPIQLAINPAGTRVFVIGTIGKRAQVLDVATLAPIVGNPIVVVNGDVPYTGVVSPDGKTLYVGCPGSVGGGGQAVYVFQMASFGNSIAPNASVGSSYSFSPNAINASSFSLYSGTLPAGLVLNSSTGAITGTPTITGTFSFTILATGDVDNSQSYQIQVDSALANTGNSSTQYINFALMLFTLGLLLFVVRQRAKSTERK